ncbi:MAG: hypothetical protein JSV59_13725 [Flavobacteriaceae bacterium]|nr:MAG: hypothetical protein JSV59_13725 [Flavobacteriaceae bacterium]
MLKVYTIWDKNNVIIARALAPNNSRSVLSKTQWDKSSSKYLGRETAPYCKDEDQALELFANFKPIGHFILIGVNNSAAMIPKNCNNQ